MLKQKKPTIQQMQWWCEQWSRDFDTDLSAEMYLAEKAYAVGASSRDDEIETLRHEVDAIAGIEVERESAQARIRQLCDLVRRVHKAKGRHHTHLAICDLYEAVGLPCERPNKPINHQSKPE